MNRSSFILLIMLAASIVFSSVAHAAKEPLRLKPSSKWVMRHEDDSCRLVRLFGEGEDKVMLVLTRFGPTARFRMTLAGEPVKIHNNKRPLTVQFGTYEAEQNIPYARGEAGGLPALVALRQVRIDGAKKSTRANRLTMKRYEAVEFMNVRVGQKRPIVLETGSFAKPVRAMRTCIQEMMTDWGIDVQRHKARSKPVRAIGNVKNWIRGSDYPSDMLREKQPALINYRLSVDEFGKATACHIQQTTRAKEFDDAICDALLKRASFTPALDADGQPIASYWRSQVYFTIRN